MEQAESALPPAHTASALGSDFVLESGNTNNHLSLSQWMFARIKVVNVTRKAMGTTKVLLTELCFIAPSPWSAGILQSGLTFLCSVLVNHGAVIKRAALPGYSIYVAALLFL